jgi:hypothetical protein
MMSQKAGPPDLPFVSFPAPDAHTTSFWRSV